MDNRLNLRRRIRVAMKLMLTLKLMTVLWSGSPTTAPPTR